MNELSNFPMLSQLADLEEVNRYYDCVPTAIAAGMMFLTGRQYHGATLKDLAYGVGYQGGTAASAYVEYCATQDVDLWAIDGAEVGLVNQACQEIYQGHPCLFTEPDPYSSAAGMTHVVIAYKFDATTLTVMDPFIAAPIKRPRRQWAQLLLFNEVWPMKRKEIIQVSPTLTANDDDKQVWSIANDKAGNAIPLIDSHGIPQSWLQARWRRGQNFGYPAEQEHAITRNGVKFIEQQFSAARASYNTATGKTVWWFPGGSVEI